LYLLDTESRVPPPLAFYLNSAPIARVAGILLSRQIIREEASKGMNPGGELNKEFTGTTHPP
jgi:hypothetical protein